jgi:hypothetical protein
VRNKITACVLPIYVAAWVYFLYDRKYTIVTSEDVGPNCGIPLGLLGVFFVSLAYYLTFFCRIIATNDIQIKKDNGIAIAVAFAITFVLGFLFRRS